MTSTLRIGAGLILAGLLALLMIAAAACWSGELAQLEPSRPPAPAPHDVSRQATCGELERAVGRVPSPPDYRPCSNDYTDAEAYWYCLAVRHAGYAKALEGWAMTAVAVCSP